jgi:hypothetical protein
LCSTRNEAGKGTPDADEAQARLRMGVGRYFDRPGAVCKTGASEHG